MKGIEFGDPGPPCEGQLDPVEFRVVLQNVAETSHERLGVGSGLGHPLLKLGRRLLVGRFGHLLSDPFRVGPEPGQGLDLVLNPTASLRGQSGNRARQRVDELTLGDALHDVDA
jgi:hypothetical protein